MCWRDVGRGTLEREYDHSDRQKRRHMIPGVKAMSLDVTIRQKVGFVLASPGPQPKVLPMYRISRAAILALTCGVPAVGLGQNQGLPTTQPSLVTIIREEVKVGRTAQHARNQAGWPAAFGRVNSPDYYLAITSITGMAEAGCLGRPTSSSRQWRAMRILPRCSRMG